jgi:hypothetical protein
MRGFDGLGAPDAAGLTAAPRPIRKHDAAKLPKSRTNGGRSFIMLLRVSLALVLLPSASVADIFGNLVRKFSR